MWNMEERNFFYGRCSTKIKLQAKAKTTALHSRNLSEVNTDCTEVTTSLPRVSYM
jgi:hypothetical protein